MTDIRLLERNAITRLMDLADSIVNDFRVAESLIHADEDLHPGDRAEQLHEARSALLRWSDLSRHALAAREAFDRESAERDRAKKAEP